MRESKLWFIFILAAIILIIVTSLHLMTFSSLVGTGYSEALDFGSVIVRSSDVFYLGLYIVLLGAALYHGMYGVRRILLELLTGTTKHTLISYGCLIVGIVAFTYGSYVTILSFIL